MTRTAQIRMLDHWGVGALTDRITLACSRRSRSGFSGKGLLTCWTGHRISTTVAVMTRSSSCDRSSFNGPQLTRTLKERTIR
jgi:hypothetical protein